MKEFFAHSVNDHNEKHPLEKHLHHKHICRKALPAGITSDQFLMLPVCSMTLANTSQHFRITWKTAGGAAVCAA